MHYIELNEMQFFSYHGVLKQERIVGNSYRINLKLTLDLSKAIESDQIENTINYAEVYALLKEEMNQPSNLLEHAAGRMVCRLKQTFPQIQQVELRLAKNNPPMGGDIKEAAVTIID
jgi:dihydroneopterin aldolase